MILPTGASSFTEAMKFGTEVYHHLKNVIKAKFGLDATTVGDENPKSDKSAWLLSDFLEDMYHCFIKDFPIVSLEDPFHQDHWNARAKITANICLHHDPDRKCRYERINAQNLLWSYCRSPGRYYNAYCSMTNTGYIWTQPTWDWETA
ncbi:hypothetical protein pipiens_016019 [Culex pipiens pipiens]|uniref:phosphopyruvate hydratase n=1 Tax=Culex pipiens pipiens TaxID=38569 RepID=A0ABD1CN59_CULPP